MPQVFICMIGGKEYEIQSMLYWEIGLVKKNMHILQDKTKKTGGISKK